VDEVIVEIYWKDQLKAHLENAGDYLAAGFDAYLTCELEDKLWKSHGATAGEGIGDINGVLSNSRNHVNAHFADFKKWAIATIDAAMMMYQRTDEALSDIVSAQMNDRG
jgi:hypothetical protein